LSINESNRRSWNAATVAHNSHKADQAAFFRNGGSTLFPEEVDLLGDLSGRSLVHLLCNSGQDSLSLSRLGARVTGVDISDEAVAFARTLSSDTGIPADFHRADVFDWLDETLASSSRFDIAYCSYGVLCWLPDLARFVRGVAAILAPGGRFVCVEFHPFALVFNWKWRPRHAYFSDAPVEYPDGIGDYVALSDDALTPSGYLEGVKDFVNPHPSYEFQWTIAQILTAVLDAGLSLAAYREYPYTNGWKGFEGMREEPGRRMFPPADVASLPLMFGLVATLD
jgi:SAM-dependent methyltransferase